MDMKHISAKNVVFSPYVFVFMCEGERERVSHSERRRERVREIDTKYCCRYAAFMFICVRKSQCHGSIFFSTKINIDFVD